jgi:hypothetical protein
LDQLCSAGMMMHPHTTACVWKWELGCEFSQSEVPPEAFEPPAQASAEPEIWFKKQRCGKSVKLPLVLG